MSFAQFSKKKANGRSSSSLTNDSMQNLINNAASRIQDAGYKVEDTDKRNRFEKFANLPQGQNWFFDTLELLSRPGNAIKNVIDKNIVDESQSIGQAAFRGFAGRDKVSGTDLAEKGGIDNKVGKFLVGTTLDIGLDPISYVPGGVIAKGVKGGAKLATTPIKAGYKALEEASPGFKSFIQTQVSPRAETLKDGFGYAFKPGYKDTETLYGTQSNFLKDLKLETENTRRFMQEDALGNVVKTAKETGVGAGTDVGRLMEAPLKQFEDVNAFKFPDGSRITENKGDLFKEIGEKHRGIKEIGSDIKSKQKEYSRAISEFAGELDKTDREINRLFGSLSRQAGKEVGNETRQNIVNASKELRKIESQLNNFESAGNSLLRYFKKQIREEHESKFDVMKKLRDHAPSGIKLSSNMTIKDVPDRLKSLIRKDGINIEVAAAEMGYADVHDLIKNIDSLRHLPRKLSSGELDSLARKEMERSGALNDLNQTKASLAETKATLQQSLNEITKSAKKSNIQKADQRAFVALEQNPRYQELIQQRDALKSTKDSLYNSSRGLVDEKASKIREIENEINDLRRSVQNPVTIQKELSRPARDLPTDPKVKQAAETLTKSNQMLRQYAQDNGIEIKEMEGYMTHVWSQVERDSRQRSKKYLVDQGRLGAGNPNKKILNQRELMGSAEDVNEAVGREFFEPNAYFASAIGQKRLIDYTQAMQFRKKVLDNPAFAQKFEKGMDVPNNAVVVNTNNYKFLKESGDMLEGVVPYETIGGEYVVTKAAKQALDRFQHINSDEGTKAFMKLLSGSQNTWKKLALFSPGYHVRNFVGNLWNSYAMGMNPYQLTKYTGEAVGELTNALKGSESALFKEFRQQGLLASGLTKIEMHSGSTEKSIEKAVQQMSKSGAAKVGDKIKHPFQSSRELGENADAVNRFALYKWAREKGMDPKQAAGKVTEALFDYMDLTPFEQKFMKNLMPFYTWSRKNIPYQISRFVEHPEKFQKLNYVRKNAQEAVGINEDSAPDYMKENFYMPLFGKNGKGKMLSLNLPVGDIPKLSDPLKFGTDLLSPLLKTPIELASNYNTFKRKPIEKFEGQTKQLQIPGTKKTIDIPIKLAYALEQATGQVGRGVSTFLQKTDNVDQENKFMNPSLGIGSFVKDFDAEKYDYYKQLDFLRKLQDLMLYIEQQEGAKPRTLAEIKKGR